METPNRKWVLRMWTGYVPARFFLDGIKPVPSYLIPGLYSSPSSSRSSLVVHVSLFSLSLPFTRRTCGPSSSTLTYPIFTITHNVQNRSRLRRVRPSKSHLTSTFPLPRPSHRPLSPTLPRCTTAPRQRYSPTPVPCRVVMRENSSTRPISVVRAVCGIGTWKILKQVISILAGPRHARSSHQVYPPYFSISHAMPNDLSLPLTCMRVHVQNRMTRTSCGHRLSPCCMAPRSLYGLGPGIRAMRCCRVPLVKKRSSLRCCSCRMRRVRR